MLVAALEAAANGIVITDQAGAIEWVNPAFTRMTGYAFEEVRGQNPRVLKSGRQDRAFYERLWKTIRAGQVWHDEIVNRRKDGTLYTEEETITPVADATGRITHFIAIKQDITMRKEAEKAQARLAAIIEATSDLVGIADPTGRRLYLNRAGRRLLGIGDYEDVSSLTINAAFHEPMRQFLANEAIPTALRDGSWRGETVLATRDGREIPVSQVIIAHSAPSGDVEFLSTIARDISERKRAEEQLQRQFERLGALREIDMAITASMDLRVTLDVLLDKVTAQLGVDAADVLLLNPHTQTLDYAAGRGFRTAALQHTHLRMGEGYAGRAVLERRTVTIPGLGEAPGELAKAPLLAAEHFTTYIGTPLVAKGLVQGVLELFHRVPVTSDQEWQDSLDAFAGQGAIAISDAQQFEALQRSNSDLRLAYDATLEGWARALELRDKETEGHTQRVTELTVRLAERMRIAETELVHVRRGALLHDIGKLAVSDTVLLKPGPLTPKERTMMERHPVFAHDLLMPIPYLRPALDIPYCHHERWDGTGYPRGLKGEFIPLAARIFAVVDVWDALTSNRPYRRAWSKKRARQYLRDEAGGQFDPHAVDAFLAMLEQVEENTHGRLGLMQDGSKAQ
ncbi:MAG TPA: HD domain-containing phosphohydrolase [bacterium]|nr:HD domain-containing phosphohydrolase [bacterium]